MAKKVAKKINKKQTSSGIFNLQSPFSIYWGNKNYIILGAAVALLIIGFVFLSVDPWYSKTSLVAAPLILLIAYVVIVPLAILYSGRSKKAETTEKTPAQ